MKYTIGYVSESTVVAAQAALLNEGHTLRVYWETTDPEPIDSTGLCHLWPNTFELWAGKPLEDFAKGCDFIFVDGVYFANTYVLMEHCKHVIGTSWITSQMEDDRLFGKQVADWCGLDLPPVGKMFYTREEALGFLLGLIRIGSTKNYLLKGKDDTIFPLSLADAVDILKTDAFSFFTHPTHKGVFLEQQVSGHELAYGAFFDGTKFLDEVVIVTQEYKGAGNNNRGQVLTGEVGTVFEIRKAQAVPVRIAHAFNKLATFLKNTTFRGFLDINTLIDPSTGSINFIEFTCRPGWPTELEIAGYFSNVGYGYGRFLAYLSGFSPTMELRNRPCLGMGVALFAHGLGMPYSPALDKVSPRLNGHESVAESRKRRVTGATDVFVQPFDTSFDEDHAWRASDWDRFVFMTGYREARQEKRSRLEILREDVYEQMGKLSAWGHTYRDDIGLGWEAAMLAESRVWYAPVKIAEPRGAVEVIRATLDTPNVLSHLMFLEHHAFSDELSAAEGNYEDYLTEPQYVTLLVRADSFPVASAVLELVPNSTAAYFETLAAIKDPRYPYRGLDLAHYVEDVARENGYKTLELECIDSVVQYHKNNGYTILETDRPSSHEGNIWMSKVL